MLGRFIRRGHLRRISHAKRLIARTENGYRLSTFGSQRYGHGGARQPRRIRGSHNCIVGRVPQAVRVDNGLRSGCLIDTPRSCIGRREAGDLLRLLGRDTQPVGFTQGLLMRLPLLRRQRVDAKLGGVWQRVLFAQTCADIAQCLPDIIRTGDRHTMPRAVGAPPKMGNRAIGQKFAGRPRLQLH